MRTMSMKTKLAQREAAEAIAREAWLKRVEIFSSRTGALMPEDLLRECGRFGYDYANYEAPLNGYSVKTKADQHFQFACSIRQNEADTAAGL